MKTIVLKLLLVCFLTIFSSAKLYAAYTYTWTGNSSTVWELSTNWSRTGSGGTSSYPGQSGTSDIVQIGVTSSFTRQPVQSGTITVASLTIGTKTACTLTVNGVLTVNGDVTQIHNGSAGGITTNLNGTGNLTCTNFNLGDSTLPPAPVAGFTLILSFGNITYNTILNDNLANLNITQNLVLTTTSKTTNLLGLLISSNVNNPVFNFNSGIVNVGNQIQTVDPVDVNLPSFFVALVQVFPGVSSSASFLMNPATGKTSTLNLNGANALNLDGNAGYVDFYGTAGGKSTVNYGGSINQEVYTTSSPYSFTRQSPTGLDQSPNIYQSVTFAGLHVKKADSGTLSTDNNFRLLATSDTVDLASNNTILSVGNRFSSVAGTVLVQGSGLIAIKDSLTNGGVLKLGSGGLTVTGNYKNTGTYTQTTGTTLFNGTSAQTLEDGSTAGTVFRTVNFSGAGAKTITSGSFYVNSTSVLTMIGSSTLNAGGNLTLNSDSTGSATVAAILSGAIINGNVNVQRYFQGGDISHRGYRFLSSPVNTGGNFSVNFLINTVYLTGTTGVPGGFDKAGNPTLYLFRENLAPLYTTFLNSNFRGINTISGSPNYLIDSDPGTFTIPAGNGYLFFYRGDRSQDSLAAETITTYIPTNAVATTTGLLNQGNITVKNWYTPTSSYLGYSVTTGNDAVRGFNLVGNPYPSSIDWDTYGITAGSAIYAPKVKKFIYMFSPANKNYAVYGAGNPTKTGTNGATNIVESGQGFFVVDSCANCAQLIFTEAAKTNTQATGLNLLMTTRSFVAQKSNPYLSIELSADSINKDETLINFDESSNTAYNGNEDAPYFNGQGKVSLASESSDGVGLAINAIPLLKTKYVRLNVNAVTDGTYQLNLKSINDIPVSYAIWLMDVYKKDSLDMRKNKSYTFNISKNDTLSFGDKRFVLVFKSQSVTAPPKTDTTKMVVANSPFLSIYPNPASNIIYFPVPNSSSANTSYSVSIMNSTGQLVKKTILGKSAMQTNVSSLMSGTYLVLITNITNGSMVGYGKFTKL